MKAPKLYFCDTGLVCWLLGIHELRQLRSHPLRGPIFETWVVSEALKNRANLGLGQRGLTFYRDRNGVEADLVIENARGRTLLEARAADAPSPDMLRTVRRVRDHLPEPPAGDPIVVYGGDERQRWADGELLPWRMARAAALRDGAGVVQVLSGGRPIAAAGILVVSPNHPNVRWKVCEDRRAGRGDPRPGRSLSTTESAADAATDAATDIVRGRSRLRGMAGARMAPGGAGDRRRPRPALGRRRRHLPAGFR